MAHYEKFSKQGLGHIFAHVRRAYTIDENGCKRYANFGNKEIDTTRTHLNYNLCLNENGVPADQQKQYERIMQGKTLPDGYSLTINNRKDLRVVCGWVVTLPENVQAGDDRQFFQAVYDHLKKQYPHCVSAYCHYDEAGRPHLHYLFVPIFHDPKKDIYKVSANELVDRRALTTFHHDLSKAVEQVLGYEVSIMTGEATLRREQGLRGSIDILKYKALKLAEEYATLKEKFQGSGLKLSAEMAQYIVRTGQKEQFAEYQRSIDHQQSEERA
jgi:hypothetical protein